MQVAKTTTISLSLALDLDLTWDKSFVLFCSSDVHWIVRRELLAAHAQKTHTLSATARKASPRVANEEEGFEQNIDGETTAASADLGGKSLVVLDLGQ